MANITYRSEAHKNQATAVTSMTITKPSGVATDDLLIAAIVVEAAQSVTAPSGWTLLRTDGNTRIYYKVAGGSEPANYTWSWPSSKMACGVVAAYQNVDATSPINAHSGQTGSGSSDTAPSATTTRDGCMIVAIFGLDVGLFDTCTWTPPSGMTERVDIASVSRLTDHGKSVELAELAQAVAGSTGSKTATATQTGANSGSLVALQRANQVPNAPALTAPTNNAAVDLAAGRTFSWSHSDPDNDPQGAYALRRKIGAGAYEYWNAATPGWQAGLVFNATPTQSVAFDPAIWSNGTTYSWSVATKDDRGGQGSFSADNTVTGVTAPSLSALTPSGSVGSIRPAVGWTFNGGDGQSQRSYQIRVFTAAQYGIPSFNPATSPCTWDSTEVLSAATSRQVGADLTNGVTYRAYVTVSQTGPGPVYSAWAYAEFTVSLSPPAVPVLTATAEPAAASPRVRLDVQGRDNVLTESVSDCEGGITGWVADANCTLAASSAQANHGSGSLRLSASSAADMAARTAQGTAGRPVLAATQYTALASFRAETTGRSCRIKIRWYDSAGALISTDTSSNVADTTSGWVQALVTATSPAGAAYAAVVVEVLAPANAEQHYVDTIGLAPGNLSTWTLGGFLTGQTFAVEYSDDAGVTWSDLRGSPFSGGTTSQLVAVYDYEAPPNTARQYRARARSDASGVLVSSAATATQTATVTVTAWWLKDPADATLNIELPLAMDALASESAEPLGVFLPLGRATPIIVSDVVRSEQFDLEAKFVSTSAYQAFETLRGKQRTLLLQSDMAEQWYVRLGDVRSADLLKTGSRRTRPIRRVKIHAYQVDKP